MQDFYFKFNATPETIIAFFFKNNNYRYLIVGTDAANHNQIKDYLDTRYTFLTVSSGSKG